MRLMILPLLSLPLLAQIPKDLEPSFFARDPKTVMVECANVARSRQGKDSRMLAEYGRSYLASGDRAKAEEAFALAIKDDPKDITTRYLIGLAWLRCGFKTEALAAFEQIPPKEKNDLTKVACRLAEAGMAAEAEAAMTKAWELDKKDWENCWEFGRAALLNGSPELGARWFQRTLEADPAYWSAWNSVAQAYTEFFARQQAKR
jgi:tetratricopeptide (TPR) repeat protein